MINHDLAALDVMCCMRRTVLNDCIGRPEQGARGVLCLTIWKGKATKQHARPSAGSFSCLLSTAVRFCQDIMAGCFRLLGCPPYFSCCLTQGRLGVSCRICQPLLVLNNVTARAPVTGVRAVWSRPAAVKMGEVGGRRSPKAVCHRRAAVMGGPIVSTL